MLEKEYDEEMARENRGREVKKERVDMRKMLREHDEGTERLFEMTTRRSKLMQLMIKKDFKSFHTELRPQNHVASVAALPPSTTPVPKSQSGLALEAIANAA
jgi:hypothetical protein